LDKNVFVLEMEMEMEMEMEIEMIKVFELAWETNSAAFLRLFIVN